MGLPKGYKKTWNSKGGRRPKTEGAKNATVQLRITPELRSDADAAAAAADVGISMFYRVAGAYWSKLLQDDKTGRHLKRFKKLTEEYGDK